MMTRYLFTLPADRSKVMAAVQSAPPDTRVEITGAKRTLPQNDLMWALMTDVSTQLRWHGQRLTPDDWKLVFLDGLKREQLRIVPNIDGDGFVNLGRSSSRLSKEEMSDLIEIIRAFGANHGVVFNEPSSGTLPAAPGVSDAAASEPSEAGQADVVHPPAQTIRNLGDAAQQCVGTERENCAGQGPLAISGALHSAPGTQAYIAGTAGTTEDATKASAVGRAADAGQASSGPLSKFKEFWFAINDIGAFNPKHVATAARDFFRSRQAPEFTDDEKRKFERLRTIRLNVLAGVYSRQEGEEKAREVIGRAHG